MKHLLLTIIAAVLLVGCGPSMLIYKAAEAGNIKAVKQHLAAGADVNAKIEGGVRRDTRGDTPLDSAIKSKQTENRRPPPQTGRQDSRRIES